MKEFIVAGVQLSIIPNDVEANLNKCGAWLQRAVEEHQADLIVFQETVTTGFTPNIAVEDLYDLVDHIPGRTTQLLQELAKKFGVHVVFGTYERGPERPVVYNSSVLIDDKGEVIGVYRKTHPFPTERLEGGGWCTPGDEAVVVDTKLGKIGMIICYDGDFPELSRVLALQGAEIITRPSALMRSFDIWDLTTRARAYDNHVYMVAVNSVGPDAGGNYYFGNSMIVDPTAWKLAQARGGDEIISARLSPDPLRYVTTGSTSPMIFDHIEDRNVKVYQSILQEGQSAFEPSKRIPYKR